VASRVCRCTERVLCAIPVFHELSSHRVLVLVRRVFFRVHSGYLCHGLSAWSQAESAYGFLINLTSEFGGSSVITHASFPERPMSRRPRVVHNLRRRIFWRLLLAAYYVPHGYKYLTKSYIHIQKVPMLTRAEYRFTQDQAGITQYQTFR